MKQLCFKLPSTEKKEQTLEIFQVRQTDTREVCATRGIFLKNLKHTMTFLCLKWFDSSPWPGITFYLLGTALRTLNLAPTWPLLV